MRPILLVALLGACTQSAPASHERTKVRVLIPTSYKAQIRDLLESGVRDFSFDLDDIEWVDMPWYTGRDAVFAPSLAARFGDSDPDADVYFIDLYRIGSFQPSWLTRFETVVGDAFRPAFWRAARFDGEGPYAVPWSAKGNFLFYRKDLVPTPPKTFDELEEACRRIPASKLSPTMRYCLLVGWENVENDLYPALWSLQPDGKIDLSDDETVAFLSRLAAMFGDPIRAGFTVMPSATQIAKVGSKIHRRFAKGEAVFMISWNNRYRYMVGEVGDALPPTGVAPVPTAKAGAKPSSNIGTWGWIVPRAPQRASEVARARHEAAMRFVAEVSSPEAVSFFVKRDGILPARRDVALPDVLRRAFTPDILAALEQADETAFEFRDRGSDSFVHGYVRDAVQDVLTCATTSRQPLPRGLLADCGRYLQECTEEQSAQTNCLMVAIRRRLEAAQRNIEAL